MEQSKFYQIKNITEHEYTLVGCDGSVITRPIQEVDKTASAFTIQDAKDGDVLSYREGQWCFIYKGIVTEDTFKYYALLSEKGITVNDAAFSLLSSCITPATKEQREQLLKEIADAGFMWDAEKKELKKIHNALEECEIENIEHGKYYYCIKDYFSGGKKQASKGDVVQALRGMNIMALGVKANEYFLPVNSIKQNPARSEEDEYYYGIDGLYHAIAILERTLGKVEGYQTDDGMLEHKVAIDTLKVIYNNKNKNDNND